MKLQLLEGKGPAEGGCSKSPSDRPSLSLAKSGVVEDGEAFALSPEHEQHGAGEAFCVACHHTWAAVVPTGTTSFECPSCHRHMGRWKFGFYPSVGQLVRECRCGNQLFYLTEEGHLCANCGVYQRYD